MFFIGLVYETGDGVMQDKEKAIDWYKKAANLGEPAARDKLVSIGSS
jgi:TPR repeat protein